MDGWQLEQEKKIDLADYEIPNNADLAALEQNFLSLLEKLKKQNSTPPVLEQIKKELA